MAPPPMDFFAMQDFDFGPADAFIATEVDGDDIGGEFFEDLNAFEDARAMNEAAAFANKSFEVQGAYNEALGIERDIFVAPPMPFGMDGGPGMPGPGWTCWNAWTYGTWSYGSYDWTYDCSI